MGETPPDAATSGQLLRRYRAAAGCTQEEVAEQSGYSVDYIGKLERDQRAPPQVAIDRLAAVLGLGDEERARLRAALRGARSAQISHPGDAPRHGEPPSTAGLFPQATSFVGREEEVAAVAALLLRATVRLLTLTGPGGIGKTRLALHVAAHVAPSFPDGVFLVPLAVLRDPDHVVGGVLGVLGLTETGGRTDAEAMIGYLRGRQALLVLDNFEHLLPTASFVATLVAQCPRLRILVTSRAVLRLEAEQLYAVPPLPTPAPEWRGDPAALAGLDAVALFVQRARAVQDSFTLTAANAQAVGAICRSLDGLPLAIELAAARVRLFPPRALLARLSSRLALLAGGPRDTPTRHQTLRGTLDWSYNLLSPREQALFARLAVFAGGCGLQAAAAVCNPAGDLDLLEALSSLVDKSLVRAEGEQEPRFSLLETIREYAAEKLAERGEREDVRRRHADFFLALAEEIEPALTGPEQGACLARLDGELDNLRAALGGLLEHGRAAEALRLAGALYWFWLPRGHAGEGQRWLEAGLARCAAPAPGVRAAALWALGGLAIERGEHARAGSLLEEALTLFAAEGDEAGSARTLNLLGGVAWRQGAYARAVTRYEEGLRRAAALGDQRERASALLNLGIIATHQGDFPAARARLEEALAMNRARGDRRATLQTLVNLGYDATLRGDLGAAERLFEEVLATARALGIKNSIAYALENLGNVGALLGRHERAGTHLREALILAQDLGDRHLLLYVLSDLVKLEAGRGRATRAARLAGVVMEQGRRLGIAMARAEEADRERALARARKALSAAAFRQAQEGGQALTLDEAVAEALGETGGGGDDAATPSA